MVKLLKHLVNIQGSNENNNVAKLDTQAAVLKAKTLQA